MHVCMCECNISCDCVYVSAPKELGFQRLLSKKTLSITQTDAYFFVSAYIHVQRWVSYTVEDQIQRMCECLCAICVCCVYMYKCADSGV